MCAGSIPAGGTLRASTIAAGPSPCVAMLYQAYAVFACIAALAMCAGVVYLLVRPDRDRADEEAAREYFDAHGHWPDEA